MSDALTYHRMNFTLFMKTILQKNNKEITDILKISDFFENYFS